MDLKMAENIFFWKSEHFYLGKHKKYTIFIFTSSLENQYLLSNRAIDFFGYHLIFYVIRTAVINTHYSLLVDIMDTLLMRKETLDIWVFLHNLFELEVVMLEKISVICVALKNNSIFPPEF